MRVLAVNAGSSSLKLTLLDGRDRTLAAHELAAPAARVDPEHLREALRSLPAAPDAVGHRIVHGGERFTRAVRIDAGVKGAMRELVDLAPLHQPRSLAAVDATGRILPDVPAVACFDTAFHASLPAAAATYALPAAWRERWGLRRFGFHGLSHAWVARCASQLPAQEPGRRQGPPRRIVSCHLGAGASLCAIRDGASVETTMGFTPLEGLVMATRSGSVDPGMLLWLLEREALSPREMAEALEHRSGLLGLAGSADMREVLERAGAGEPACELAVEVYVHRLRAAIAAMAAALDGLEVLVFTGGVGERSSELRARAAGGLAFLGVALDASANERAVVDADGRSEVEIGERAATVRTLVLHAREDLEIARQVRELLGG